MVDHFCHQYAKSGVQDEVEDDDFDLDQVVAAMESDDWEDMCHDEQS